MKTQHSRHGMVTAPHALAARAGAAVLRDGGTAVEAGVAVAACLAVVYSHMTGIGGDGFWSSAKQTAASTAYMAAAAQRKRPRSTAMPG